MLDFVYAFHVLWLAVGVGILIALSILYAMIYRHIKKPILYSEPHQNGTVVSGANQQGQNGEIGAICRTIPEHHPCQSAACPSSLLRTGGKSPNIKLTIVFAIITFEPVHEKTNNLHMRKQRRRSASQ